MEIASSSPDKVTIKGEIRFSDKMTKEQVEKILSTNGTSTITIGSTSNPLEYSFIISNIQRKEQDYDLKITADGEPVGMDRKQSESITIPAKDSFRFLSCRTYQSA